MIAPSAAVVDKLFQAIKPSRLLDTAQRLIAEYSPTGKAKPALDCLADILTKDGFTVERPTGGHPAAPAVVVRYKTGKSGPTLQFNGHLDTVHLPFVPPWTDGTQLKGSGSSDMKAGTAAAVEALRALRDSGTLPAGGILFTAHDLHETPWGDGSQLDNLIKEGIHGDAVLLPEYLNDCIATIGRGGFVWKATVKRPGAPVHEVMRPNEPAVIPAAAELVQRITRAAEELGKKRDPQAGPESYFIGQIHAGEIFNQYPQECRLEGTRRWLPGSSMAEAKQQFQDLCAGLGQDTGATVSVEIFPMRDAFYLDTKHPFVDAFQATCEKVNGKQLPFGAKPFCDDGNSFWAIAKVPCITHGPNAGGAHTLHEWVSIEDLNRVAKVYAYTALTYCQPA